MQNKIYTITETLQARPMSLGEYNQERGWIIPADENPNTEGYFITQQNGNVTWREKVQFEASIEQPKISYTPSQTNITVTNKTLHNSNASGASVNVKDIIFWGDGDTFRLISKASSKAENWMKSSKAMEIAGIGCVIQVTTQQGTNVAEAVCFVPDVKIEETKADGKVISRKIVRICQ